MDEPEGAGCGCTAEQIEKNVEQASYLARRVSLARVELAAEVPLNLVCFRYRGANDEENMEILMRCRSAGLRCLQGR